MSPAMPKTSAALLKEANTKLDTFDFGAAIKLYRQILTREPNNASATMGLAMALNRTDKPAEAMQLLQKVWQALNAAGSKASPTLQAATLAQIGLAQQQLGRMADALNAYRHAHHLAPSAELEARINKLQEATESPDPTRQLIAQGQQKLAAGDVEQAIKLYQAALQLNADEPDALHGLANALRLRKDFDAALPVLQQAIILAPERANYYNDLGILFQERGELDKAVSFHKRCLKLTPDFVPAHINLGVAYKRLGRIDEAIAVYRQAIALKPGAAAAHNNLGNLLRMQGDLAGARAELDEALRLKPDYADAKANLVALEQEEALRAPALKAAKPRSRAKAKAPSSTDTPTATVTAPSPPARKRKASPAKS